MVLRSSDRISRVPPYLIHPSKLPIRGYHPLWLRFPTHSSHSSGLAGPRSLAATRGVSIDFLSSGYLDVSVPRVRFYNPMYSDHKYLFHPSDESFDVLTRVKTNATRPPVGGSRKFREEFARSTLKRLNQGMSGGLPHSEISGSKGILTSPELIAEYHVLHRLLLPRHPPNALFALDLIQKKTVSAKRTVFFWMVGGRRIFQRKIAENPHPSAGVQHRKTTILPSQKFSRHLKVSYRPEGCLRTIARSQTHGHDRHPRYRTFPAITVPWHHNHAFCA